MNSFIWTNFTMVKFRVNKSFNSVVTIFIPVFVLFPFFKVKKIDRPSTYLFCFWDFKLTFQKDKVLIIRQRKQTEVVLMIG